MQTISVTLTRAHKIAERLKARAGELMAEALEAAGAVHLMGVPGEAHLQRLEGQGARVLELSAQAQRYQNALATVRALIGHANDVRGINAKLAQLEVTNKLVAHFKSVFEATKSATLELAELKTYTPISTQASYGLHVNVLNAEDRAKVQTLLTQHQHEAVKLSDDIAEANAARVSIELEDDIATVVTGAV